MASLMDNPVPLIRFPRKFAQGDILSYPPSSSCGVTDMDEDGLKSSAQKVTPSNSNSSSAGSADSGYGSTGTPQESPPQENTPCRFTEVQLAPRGIPRKRPKLK